MSAFTQHHGMCWSGIVIVDRVDRVESLQIYLGYVTSETITAKTNDASIGMFGFHC
jgi:hypothetical protein